MGKGGAYVTHGVLGVPGGRVHVGPEGVVVAAVVVVVVVVVGHCYGLDSAVEFFRQWIVAFHA